MKNWVCTVADEVQISYSMIKHYFYGVYLENESYLMVKHVFPILTHTYLLSILLDIILVKIMNIFFFFLRKTFTHYPFILLQKLSFTKILGKNILFGWVTRQQLFDLQ